VSGHELFIGYDLPVKIERPDKPMQVGQDQLHLGKLLSDGKLGGVIVPGDTGYPAIFGGGETVPLASPFLSKCFRFCPGSGVSWSQKAMAQG
jgi:hypothetical protein